MVTAEFTVFVSNVMKNPKSCLKAQNDLDYNLEIIKLWLYTVNLSSILNNTLRLSSNLKPVYIAALITWKNFQNKFWGQSKELTE